MTTQEHFEKYLKGYINLRDEDINKVKVHIDLREKLEGKLSFKGKGDIYSFLTGSYIRNTAIRPPKDVDFFIVLDDKIYGNISPTDLLQLLEKTIKDIVPDKTIVNQSHSITIEYDDEFGIDVIPAFEDGADKYKIPEVETNKESWLLSNPKVHKDKLTKANEINNGHLVPIIKLLKSWKNSNCDYFKSFHLELLAIRILETSDLKTIASGIDTFFSNAAGYLATPCMIDPANNTNVIDSYLSNIERQQLLNLITAAKAISNNAIIKDNQGATDDAIKEWNKLFSRMSNEDKIAAISVISSSREMPKPWSTES